MDDLINEAIFYAAAEGSGEISPAELRRQLEQRGLFVVKLQVLAEARRALQMSVEDYHVVKPLKEAVAGIDGAAPALALPPIKQDA